VLNDTKQQLEKINEVSRQLLSQILTMQNNLKEIKTDSNAANNDDSNSSGLITDKELTELVATRHRLIHGLFEQNTREEISTELHLVNEMMPLDAELSKHFEVCKQILAEQVIRLKKRKKISKSYQKY
jgi:tRNA isopentenyl-2-thiomethyl-A-37 hydroxylase MiaE